MQRNIMNLNEQENDFKSIFSFSIFKEWMYELTEDLVEVEITPSLQRQ